jgi:V/A-type H+-transporting ATPase subunit I
MAPGHGDPGSVLCRLQGWTSDPAGLGAALAGVRAVAGFPPAPPGSAAPLLLSNPAWVRPFELFAGLLGTPGRHSADPSMLVAVLFPLLFGYMFGDVGQGLVLAALGLLLRRRWPIARLLIAGGIASVAFGFVFGSVFSVHGALSPLWADPLSKPLPVLAVPLAGGVLLLVVGAAIAALEAYWDGRLGDWLIGEAPMLLAYLGLIAALAESGAAALAVLGLAAAAIGPALSERRVGAAWRGIGALVEKTLQMLINTLSFVRVGAFALAHAGLSAAVVALAEATDSRVGYAIVMVAGNVVVMTIEVLVVSIQTTRLLLFEFFIRFFSGQGRAFRPLAGPSDTFWEDLHEPGT